jgi:hypothetical protein
MDVSGARCGPAPGSKELTMTGRFARCRPVVLRLAWHGGVAAALLAALSARAAGQLDAGNLAPRIDREIRAAYDAVRDRTEAVLTLLPHDIGGASSSLSLAIHASFPGREPAPGGVRFELRAYPGPLSDARRVRPTELKLTLETEEGRRVSLWLFGASWGQAGFVPPGGEIPWVYFAIGEAELRALAAAERISGQALGYEFELTPEQVRALRGFGLLVLPDPDRRGAP